MGTRHVTMVVLQDEVVLAQYGQWDGYPSGQGETVLDFIINHYDYKKFTEELAKLTPITDEIWQEIKKEAGVDRNDGWLNVDEANRIYSIVPELNRDTGAEILKMIQDGKAKYIGFDKDFIDDTMFCEWAYILYLDTDELEVYGRGKPSPLKPKYETDNTLVARYKFSELTETTMKELSER